MNDLERENWLKERKNYIGGSNIAAVMRLNTYSTAVGVYIEKTTGKINNNISEKAKRGILLEDAVSKMYEEETGFKIEIEQNTIYHPEHNFLAANIDRWVYDEKNNQKFILECKTTGQWASRGKEKDGSLLWGEQYTDQIPQSYLCQVAWYAAICDMDRVDIALLILKEDEGQEFRIYTYTRDRNFEEKLIKAAQQFWNDYILQGIPPKCIELEDTTSLWPISNGGKILADDNILQKIQELKTMKAEREQLDEAIKAKKIDIMEFMQNYELLVDNNDQIMVSWKNTRPRISFNSKLLQKEHAGIYNQCISEVPGSRVFLIK